jgi:DNA-binding CsgD family transcriptional regulator
MRATLTGEPADATLALVWPALDSGALDAEPDTALRAIALFTLIANDQLAMAIAACDTVIDAARPRGWLIALAMASHMRAMALVPAGRIRDAELDARLGFDYKLAAAPIDVVLWPLHTLVDARVELDELDDAEVALAAAGQQGDPPAGAVGAPLLLQSRARLRLAQHRHEDALADARAAAARWAELGVGHPGVAGWRVDAADALVALGDPVTARELADEHLALADRLGLRGPTGAGLRALARAVSPAERIALLERAAALLADSPNRLERTRALVDLGAALRRANRRSDARAPLRRALDVADRGGMRRLAHRARHELRAAGARPRRTALSGIAALTPAEHRVAALAADGHSNREIAQRLYITQRTVETHLTHAFQKLDITSRAELARGFADHDQQDAISTPAPPIPAG